VKSATKHVVRKRPGRPATGQDPVTAIRLSPQMRASVDAWASGQEDQPGRSVAIRRLVELGLTVKTKGGQFSEGQKLRAREMAGAAIDKMTDTAATTDDQATRKKRLLKGPEEFQSLRVDRPNRKT
jgi:hypothetical protein